MHKRNERRAVAAGLLFAVVVGFAFIANKEALVDGGVYDVLAYRFLFALAALPPVLKVAGESLRIKRRDIPAMFLLCASYVLFLYFQLLGLLTCSTIIGAIFFATSPVFIALFAIPMLHERLGLVGSVAVLVGAGAVIAMVSAGSGAKDMTLAGALFLGVSTLLNALYSVWSRQFRVKFSPVVIAGWLIVAGSVFFSILLLADHIKTGSVADYFVPLTSLRFFLSSAYLGIGCILLSSLTITYAFRILPAARASVFNNISTVISILAGGLLLHEPLTSLHIVCAVLVIGAAFVLNHLDTVPRQAVATDAEDVYNSRGGTAA